ncbi:MAG: CocE/NonD family hydrolase [Ruminococcaceae bacterium]|nr:CocE/NonD family hydrolase [Oscillospiraceae bacterium]
MKKVYCEYLDVNGIKLFTVICLPDENGKFPIVITRSPYVDHFENKSDKEMCDFWYEDSAKWTNRGYALVHQHCRGRGKSEGDCIPYVNERNDGNALYAWVREQAFYGGELYLVGASYTAAVHMVTPPYDNDIKGAVLEVYDHERYNCNYRNGFYKVGLHGGWYVTDMYKNKTMPKKPYTAESFNMLPLSDFSMRIFGENAEDLNEVFKHPDKNDSFWKDTLYGGNDSRDSLVGADIPILFTTGHYDIFTGGIYDMWRGLDDKTRSKSAMAVHPYSHGGHKNEDPIGFEGAELNDIVPDYRIAWLDHIRKGSEAPFKKGKITYYKSFGNEWCCDDFNLSDVYLTLSLGEGVVSYSYDPKQPTRYVGGLSCNFGGCQWQEKREDVVSIYTDVFKCDTFVKGKIKAKLKVKSDCEDTCFYIRISLCKKEGDYPIRDDIQKISNFNSEYVPGDEIDIEFLCDEHAFVIAEGERLRIDISSSAFPFYVPHTNYRGLFSEQRVCKTAYNTLVLHDSIIELPLG